VGDDLFLGLRWLDVATITAIVLGPILAVAIDRIQQRWTDKKRRRLEILRDLMRTRRARLDPMHVGALNLVDLEFYGCRAVMDSFRHYIEHLSSPLPMPAEQERFFARQEDLLVELLHAMGRQLGYSYDKRDLERLAYGPTGWNNDQNMQRQNMMLLNELLNGKRAFPVTPMQPTSHNPFPPAPIPQQQTPPTSNGTV
jgi:hypothetical protein